MKINELIEGAYQDGFNDGLRGQRDQRASSKYGPMTDQYDAGYMDGVTKSQEKQGSKTVNQTKYDNMSREELKNQKQHLENLRSKISKEMEQARGSGFSPNTDFYKRQDEIYKKYDVSPDELANELDEIVAALERKNG